MDCEQALILISAALDGEVTEAERLALEEHLNSCPDCKALAEDFGVFSVALSGMNADAPDDLTANVNAALDTLEAPAAPAPVKKSRHWKAWGSLAAMFAVVVCLGGVFTLSGTLSGSRDGAAMESAPRASSPAIGIADAAPAEAPDTAGGSVKESAAAEHSYSAHNSAAEPSAGAAQGTYRPMETVVENGEFIVNDLAPAESVPPVVPAMETDLTPTDGLMQVYELLGGTAEWPDAAFDYDAQDCVLAVEESDGVTLATSIRYTGLSQNGWYYTYQLNTEEDDGFTCRFSFVNYYALKLDGSELLAAFGDERSNEDLDAFNAQING